jgi:methionine salvage enolase-phosphatase E1
MANLKVPKPKAIIFDLSGTAAKTSFIDKVLIPYIKSYVKQKWIEKELTKDVERLRATVPKR